MASPDKALEIQMQVRRNASEMQDFLKDLDSWEDDIKKKDEALKTQKGGHEPALPPIRNRATAKKKKKKVKTEEKREEASAGQQNGQQKKPKRISGYDYRSWDKFDVDKELEKMEGEEEQKESSSEYESESDSEKALEQQRLLQQALMEKDRGNSFFKDGRYEEALSCYTTGMDADPKNAVLPANRAMALLKLNRFEDAIRDCTLALDLDPTYTKAYHRRATARMELSKLEDAKRDFEKVLSLEPSNKQAQTELRRIKKALDPTTKKSETAVETKKQQPKDPPHMVRPINKPVHLRSKKPLRRLVIEEIGGEDERSTFQPTLNPPTTELPAFPPEDIAQMSASYSEKSDTGGEERKVRENLIQEVEQSPSVDVPKVSVNRPPNVERRKPASPRGQQPVVTSDPPAIPAAPTTALQMQADWRRLHSYPELLYIYFKQIPPSMYAKLFQQSLESDILNSIMTLLRDFYLPNKDDVYSVLCSLSEVKRFNMAVMFMSAKDKQVVLEVFKGLKLRGQQSREEIEALCKKYEVEV